MFKVSAFWLFLLVCTAASWSQDCDAILSHGIRNIRIEKRTEATVATNYFNHCHKDFADLNESDLGSVEVEIFGFGAGGGEKSRTKREQRLTEWCKENRETARANRTAYLESQTIHGQAVEAWRRCNDLKSQKIQVIPQISPDALTLSVNLKYGGSAGSGIKLYGVDAENFNCKVRVPDGSSVDFSKPIDIDRQAASIYCTRPEPAHRSRNGEEFLVLPRGVVSIQTADSPIQFYFPEEWTPDLPASRASEMKARLAATELPLGTIIAWYSKGGPLPEGWVVCDGTNGTPDLRGRFLRGVAAFEEVGKLEGEEKHVHKVAGRTGYEVEGTTSGPEGADNFTGDPNWNHKHDLDLQSGEADNIPPSMTVVYLLKVRKLWE